MHAAPQVYGVKCIDEETEGETTHTSGPHGLPPAGYAESYQSNICILPAAGDPYMVSGGVLADPAGFASGMVLGNNTIYAPRGAVSVTLSGDKVTFEQFQSKGFDASSAISGEMPSNEQIIAWGRPLLYAGRSS